MRGVFESEGDIRSVDLLSALVALWREKAGGALRFSRPGATAGFDISGGEVTAMLSSQAQFDAAAILIRAAKLDPAAVDRLTMPGGSDTALAAMQAGLITAREWRWGQKIRAIEILSDLLGWLEGEYVLEPGNAAPPGDWTLPVSRLVLELFLRSRDRTLVEHYLGPSDLPLLRAETFDEEFVTFGLTADAGSVVRLIDGEASAEEIAEKSPADEFAALKLLAALTTLGLVHPAEAVPASPPRRPATLPRGEPGSGPPRAPEPPPDVREEARPPESEPEAEQVARPEIGPAAEEEASSRIEKEAKDVGEPEAGPAPERPEEQEEVAVPEPLAPGEPEKRESAGEPAAPAVAPRRAPAPEPVTGSDRRLAGQTRSPADTAFRPASHQEAFDRALNLTGGREPSPDPPKSGSGVVLAVLLATLIIAVTTLVLVRTRGGAHEQPASTRLYATVRENPVFPPAETAVPLPGHGRGVGRPSPAWTAAVTITPAASLTAPPMAAPPLTSVPTRFQPTLPATAVPTRLEPTRTPTAAPTRPEPTKPPTRIPTRPAPTRPEPAPPAAPAQVPPPTAPPAAVAATRGELTRADWIRRAERDKRSAKRRGVRYSIQLELACELPTLENALNRDRPPGTIWLVTSSYRGRTCFRVLWGRYGSLGEARAAKPQVPEFFTVPGNRPIVVSVR